eukprot:TRINITY_DN15235_c0_g1_i1.p1 TRINITY_DN15235_c0_g1~~TRINITY_DN15235_c0_g1_i1.p1  ORF type:complete len:268 (-),score=110.54 TRINITY_DN15235_c0_g1_i1:128-931(-)
MRGIKSRTEINLTRLLARCQDMANNSTDLATEWRLPKFVSSCEDLFHSLPKPPDSSAPSQDSLMEYQNKIQFLKSMLPPCEDTDHPTTTSTAPNPVLSVPLPQGPAMARDTVSKQIYQKASERQNASARDQLFGVDGEEKGMAGLQGVSLDKILADHRDQQEKVAEEMIKLTQSLKEQSAAAGTLIRGDTARLEQSSVMAENNLDKLGVEAKRVGEFSARGNCRCWIWLMMGIVILTFVGMVLMMRLFSKKLPVVEVKPQSSIRSEL